MKDDPRTHPYFLCADYRQAEAMIVAWLANEQRLIDIFLSGGDVHTRNASMIFRLPPEKINPQMRYLGKKVAHGANYGLGPKRLSEIIMEETEGKIIIRQKLAQELIDSFHAAYPNIRRNYHPWVRAQLDAEMTLWTPLPFGRRRVFWGRWKDEATYGEGYAMIPQSIGSADSTNEALRILSKDGYDVRLQKHDELVLIVSPKELVHTWRAMDEAMRIPLNFRGPHPDPKKAAQGKIFCECASDKILEVPRDFSVGRCYGEMKEMKKMTREQIEEYLNHLEETGEEAV